MKYVLSLFVLLLSVSASASPWSEGVKQEIDKKIAQHFRNRTQVGVVIGVTKGDETHFWTYGERVLGSGEAPTPDTYFEMGSITKTFTATLLAREVLEGRVKLTDQVKSLWPELSGFDAGEVTLEQLATHSSGLPRMPSNFAPADPLDPYKDYTEANLFDYLKSFKQGQPGPRAYAYSNLGLGLLGYLISQKLHKETYSDYLEKNLLHPLGLLDTKTALLPADLSRAAQGYGNFFNLMPLWDLNVLSPAGVLKTTARDLLRYASHNMKHDSTTLLGQAMDLAQQARADAEEGFKVGLAWESGPLGDRSVVTHGGATGGYRANLIFDRANETAVVILSNTDMSPRCAIAPVFGTECKITEYATVEPEKFAKLLGTYVSDELKMTARIFMEGELLALQIVGQPKARLWATSESTYVIPDARAQLTFTSGKKFMLTQNGRDFDFLLK